MQKQVSQFDMSIPDTCCCMGRTRVAWSVQYAARCSCDPSSWWGTSQNTGPTTSVTCATKHSWSADNSNFTWMVTAVLCLGRSERQFNTWIQYESFPVCHSVMSLETNVRRYKCSLCSVTCQGASGLREHQRIHTGERPFSCSQCERRFKRLQVPSCILLSLLH